MDVNNDKGVNDSEDLEGAFVMFFDWDILNGSQLADASFPHLRGKSEFYLFIYWLFKNSNVYVDSAKTSEI